MHTKEPWRVDEIDYKSHQFYIRGSHDNGEPMTFGNGAVAHMPRSRLLPTKENARRIVACVNACAGISTEELEYVASDASDGKVMASGILSVFCDAFRLRNQRNEQQRDELLAAAKRIRQFVDEGDVSKRFWSEQFKSALSDFDATIAKCES